MASTDPDFQAYIDAEKGETGDTSDDEGVENPSEIQPRFFRTPSVDLVPSAAQVAAARRRSSVRAESLRRKKSAGPSSPAESVKLRSPSIHEAREERGNRSEQYIGDNTIKTAYEPLDPDDQEVIRFGGPYTFQDLSNELSGLCTVQTLQRKLPITRWLAKYSREDFKGDFVAGLTVGLTVVPQCLAYAQIADIGLEYGLNSAYMGCFCYALLGTSKDVTVGPTAILSLLTGAFIHREHGLEGKSAIVLCFLVGCFQLMMGFLRLGFLMNFISTPVVSGFTQAAVIVIILSQIKNMMGVSFGSAKDNVLETLAGYWRKLPATNGWDVLMGCVCITLLLLMRELRMPAWKATNGRLHPPKWWDAAKEFIRLMNVSRYAIVVVVATIFEFVMEYCGLHYLSVTGKVDAKISAPEVPDFHLGGWYQFGEVLSHFGSSLVLVPLLATMESMAVAKTFAHKFRYNIDVTQEFLALGTANVVSSFFGSYPVTGAFTRSALQAESGARTSMACIVTGTFVIIAILGLGPIFQFIPKAALAAVIICACLTMFDFQIFRELWLIRKSEFFVLVLTMSMCLFLRVEYGLLIGLAVSLAMIIYPMARPVVIVRQRRRELIPSTPRLNQYTIHVTPQSSLFFPASENLKEIFNDQLFTIPVNAYSTPRESMAGNGAMALQSKEMAKASNAEMREALPPIVFDGVHLTSSDYSTLRALRSVYVNCKAAHRDIEFRNTSDEILDLIMPFRDKKTKSTAK